ncbi:MAG TPA: hypothetical protein VGO67_05830 [Verrucomicrobiae bacterium]|jgi:hypothetical protein
MSKPILCPECRADITAKITPHLAAAAMGRAGRGKRKARTSAQARAAVNARWAKVRAAKLKVGPKHELTPN